MLTCSLHRDLFTFVHITLGLAVGLFQGCSEVRTRWTENDLPTPFSTALKHTCNPTDVIVTRRFALLCCETGRSSVEIFVGEYSLYSN